MTTDTSFASAIITHSIILCILLFTPAAITTLILRMFWKKLTAKPWFVYLLVGLFGTWAAVTYGPRVAAASRRSYEGVRNVFRDDSVRVNPNTGEVFE